jgi:hypothetical protein
MIYNAADMNRPMGITVTAILMSITNAMGWMMIDWHTEKVQIRFVTYSLLILIGYVFLWFYWQGRNWARLSVIACSLMAILNLSNWNSSKPGTILLPRHIMIASEAAIALFLLYWLNTRPIRSWFHTNHEGFVN